MGDPAWASAFEDEFGARAQRWVHFNDPIPTFAPSITGFDHPAMLYNLDESGAIDDSGQEMGYFWGPASGSHLFVEHMCYFDAIADLFLGSSAASGHDDWPEMEVCSAP